MSKFKDFIGKLTKKHRIIVFDDYTLEERKSINLSALYVVITIGLFALVFTLITSSIWYASLPLCKAPPQNNSNQLQLKIKDLTHQIDVLKKTGLSVTTSKNSELRNSKKMQQLQDSFKLIHRQKEGKIIALQQDISAYKLQLNAVKKNSSTNSQNLKSTLDLEKRVAYLNRQVDSTQKANSLKDKASQDLQKQLKRLNNKITSLEKNTTPTEIDKSSIAALHKEIDSLTSENKLIKTKSINYSVKTGSNYLAGYYQKIDSVSKANSTHFLNTFQKINPRRIRYTTLAENPTTNTETLHSKIILLDVRPTIESGVDPFVQMTQAIHSLKSNETLKIINYYEPTVLLNKYKHDYTTSTIKKEESLYHMFFTKNLMTSTSL